VIYLVRHAAAMAAAAWPGTDSDRPLSPPGHRAAEGIASHLSARPITRILSSPRRRCLDTAAPLAAARGTAVEIEPTLDEDAVTGDARTWLEAPAPGLALFTHAPVIADFLTGLSEAGAVLQGTRTVARASIWELSVEGGRITSGRYLPPPE
jgi:8-oxo-dGTP diphosphatase